MVTMYRARSPFWCFPRQVLNVSISLLLAVASISAADEPRSESVATRWNGQTRMDQGAAFDFNLPRIHYDVTSAELWRCSTANVGVNAMKAITSNGHQHQLEVLKLGPTWADLLTSTNSIDKLNSLGLTDCTTLANINELLTSELRQNWRTLHHHSLHPSWQNTVEHTSRGTEGAGRSMASLPDHSEEEAGGSHDRLKRDVDDLERRAAGRCLINCDNGGSYSDRVQDVWFSQYHNYSEIYNWFYALAKSHPDTVYLNRSIGRTYYGRDILAVHITDLTRRREGSVLTLGRPKIYFQCLLHPREWVTGSVCMYLAMKLASPSPQSKLKSMLSQVEFVIVPVANPDGYFLTWFQYPKYRLWRKNLQSFDGEECAGVDLNRNFDVTNWSQDVESRSSDHCSELYGGPHGGSELEVKAISNYFTSLSPVIGAIDFHSYHQEVLYPPASTYEVPDSVVNVIDKIAGSVASSASDVGVAYSYRKMIDVYSATGTFADWMLMRSLSGEQSSNCLVPLTIELRPTFNTSNGISGMYSGFLLPATEILPACQEMFAATLTFAQLSHQHGITCLNRP